MFESVKTNRISEYIISQIRSAVFEGKLKPGDRLPPEHLLMETFGVSKATLREALRGLELLGFLQVRKGVEGGAVITEVDIKPALGCLTNYLHFKNLSIGDLGQVRLLLESYGVEKAALAISPAEIGKLKELNEACAKALDAGDGDEIRKNEIEFHRIIAGVTQNPILVVLVDIIENLLDGFKETLQPDRVFSEKVLAAHGRIIDALEQRDPRKTREEMLNHLREVEEDLILLQKQRQEDKL